MRKFILFSICLFLVSTLSAQTIFKCDFEDKAAISRWKSWNGGNCKSTPAFNGPGFAAKLWGTSSGYFDFNRYSARGNGSVKLSALISCNFTPKGKGKATIGFLNAGKTTWQAALVIDENGTISFRSDQNRVYAGNFLIKDKEKYTISISVDYMNKTAGVEIQALGNSSKTKLIFNGKDNIQLDIPSGLLYASRVAFVANAGTELLIDDVIIIDTTPKGGRRTTHGDKTFRLPAKKVINPRVGLCIHDCYTTREVNVLANSGVDMVRWHYTWEKVFKNGKFSIPESGYDYIRGLVANRMEPLMILAYSHPGFDVPKKRPDFGQFIDQNEKWYKGWGGYCAWMAQTFGSRGTGQVKFWEIWNEENAGPAEQYMKVLEVAVENIRREDPEAFIIFGGISRMDMDFTEKCMKLGAGKLIDGFAFHPYRESTFPEDGFQLERRFKDKTVSCYADELKELSALIKKYTPKGKKISLWITEMGYCTQDSEKHLNPELYIDHDVKAKYMLRSLVQSFALGVDTVVIYRATHSSFFGLTYGAKFRPRSGYFAIQDFCKIFPQKQNVKILPWDIKSNPAPSDMHAYAFQVDPKNVLLFVWNAGKAESCIHRITIKQRKPKYTLSIPVSLENIDKIECTDIFLAETIELKAINTQSGQTVIKDVPVYDSPLVLKLQLKKE